MPKGDGTTREPNGRLQRPKTRIVEVVHVTHDDRANAYLAHGYNLIGDPHTTTRLAKHPNNPAGYIRREVTYVLGRTAEVEHFDYQLHGPPAANMSAAVIEPGRSVEAGQPAPGTLGL